jgi:LacI family transcriptional regulator
MRKLQLEDLSKKLGVSKTLISMVINGKGDKYGISRKTQAAVLQAIVESDYSPNRFARTLRTGRSNFIGLIVSDISNPYYSNIIRTIEQTLHSNGVNLMLGGTGGNEEIEMQKVERMISRQGVDGLIVASAFRNPSFYAQPRLAKIPIVFIDRLVPAFNANYVLADNFGGARNLANHVLDKGCRQIACFALAPLDVTSANDQIRGLKKALAARGIAKGSQMIKPVRDRCMAADVQRHLRKMVESGRNYDAIFVLNSAIAAVLLKILRKKEFRNLADVQVASFDDTELFNMVTKKVVSVSQPTEDIGASASRLLLDLITGKLSGNSTVVLNTKMVVR